VVVDADARDQPIAGRASKVHSRQPAEAVVNLCQANGPVRIGDMALN
jgi:hypothetical protein